MAAESQDGDDTQAPYRGLARFEPADAQLFFGRDELAAQLAERYIAHRLVAVVGASGSGKSSLLRAGLIPLLQSRCLARARQAAVVGSFSSWPAVLPTISSSMCKPGSR
ncbi:nSTAND1 domain-containing NTPase [Streptomyces herbicida]